MGSPNFSWKPAQLYCKQEGFPPASRAIAMDTRNFMLASLPGTAGIPERLGAGAHGAATPCVAGANTLAVVALSARGLGMALQRAASIAEALNVRHVDALSAGLARAAGLAVPAGSHGVIHEIAAPDWGIRRTAAPSLVIAHHEALCASVDAFDRACIGWLGGAGVRRTMPLVLGWCEHRLLPQAANLRRQRYLARHSGAPVLLVRQAPPPSCRHVLFPTDFSAHSLAGLGAALAVLPLARFTLLHSARMPGEAQMRIADVSDSSIDACRHALETQARSRFARVAAASGPHARRLSLVILREPLVHAVARYAATVRIDVIAVAGPPGGVVDSWLWKGTVRNILKRTSCDLLLVGGDSDRGPLGVSLTGEAE